MKQKTLTLITAIFLIGIISATGTITNLSPSLDIPSFIAGGTTSTTFSFDYEDDFENNPDASLVLKVNINSLNEDYPVWKGDFQLGGFIEQYPLFGLSFLEKIIPLKCVEDIAKFRVQQGLLYTETNIPNGTFYCYTTDGDLKLDKGDNVFLNITSNYALYPGQYNLTAKLYYLNDTYPPFVNITNKNAFERYYMALDNIEVVANITDVDLNPNSIQGIISTRSEERRVGKEGRSRWSPYH